LDLCRPSHGFQLVDLLKLLGFGKSGACHATQPRNMCGEIPSPCLFIIIHIHNIYIIYIYILHIYICICMYTNTHIETGLVSWRSYSLHVMSIQRWLLLVATSENHLETDLRGAARLQKLSWNDFISGADHQRLEVHPIFTPWMKYHGFVPNMGLKNH
jgi:hypothetical protein